MDKIEIEIVRVLTDESMEHALQAEFLCGFAMAAAYIDGCGNPNRVAIEFYDQVIEALSDDTFPHGKRSEVLPAAWRRYRETGSVTE